LLTVLFWSGVGLAPLAALVLLLGTGGGPLRVAAVLAVLAMVLIGLSITLRRDTETVRIELEETILDEIELLRTDMRDDIAAATNSTQVALAREVEALHAEVRALRGRLDSDAPAPGPATRAQRAPAPGAAFASGSHDMLDAPGRATDVPGMPGLGAHGMPGQAGVPGIPGEVVRHTETVHVTTRKTTHITSSHPVIVPAEPVAASVRVAGTAPRPRPEPPGWTPASREAPPVSAEFPTRYGGPAGPPADHLNVYDAQMSVSPSSTRTNGRSAPPRYDDDRRPADEHGSPRYRPAPAPDVTASTRDGDAAYRPATRASGPRPGARTPDRRPEDTGFDSPAYDDPGFDRPTPAGTGFDGPAYDRPGFDRAGPAATAFDSTRPGDSRDNGNPTGRARPRRDNDPQPPDERPANGHRSGDGVYRSTGVPPTTRRHDDAPPATRRRDDDLPAARRRDDDPLTIPPAPRYESDQHEQPTPRRRAEESRPEPDHPSRGDELGHRSRGGEAVAEPARRRRGQDNRPEVVHRAHGEDAARPEYRSRGAGSEPDTDSVRHAQDTYGPRDQWTREPAGRPDQPPRLHREPSGRHDEPARGHREPPERYDGPVRLEHESAGRYDGPVRLEREPARRRDEPGRSEREPAGRHDRAGRPERETDVAAARLVGDLDAAGPVPVEGTLTGPGPVAGTAGGPGIPGGSGMAEGPGAGRRFRRRIEEPVAEQPWWRQIDDSGADLRVRSRGQEPDEDGRERRRPDPWADLRGGAGDDAGGHQTGVDTGERWTTAGGAAERWARLRTDDRGAELQAGERTASVRSDADGTEVRVSDRWTRIRRDGPAAEPADPGRGERSRRSRGRRAADDPEPGREPGRDYRAADDPRPGREYRAGWEEPSWDTTPAVPLALPSAPAPESRQSIWSEVVADTSRPGDGRRRRDGDGHDGPDRWDGDPSDTGRWDAAPEPSWRDDTAGGTRASRHRINRSN